jgi:hypothetical protein
VSIETDLSVLKSLNRFNYPSLDGTAGFNENAGEKEKRERMQLQDILWSGKSSFSFIFDFK